MLDIYNQYITSKASSSYTYINIAIVALNALSGIILHFILFGKRRKNERLFQTNAAIYNKVVVENLEKINFYFSDTQEKAASFITSKTALRINGDALLRSIESKCDELEHSYEEFVSKVLPIFQCYCESLCSDIIDLSDSFSSGCTSIITRLNTEGAKAEALLQEMDGLKVDYLSAVFQKIKESKPK